MKLDRYGQLVTEILQSDPKALDRVRADALRGEEVLWAGKPDPEFLETATIIAFIVFATFIIADLAAVAILGQPLLLAVLLVLIVPAVAFAIWAYATTHTYYGILENGFVKRTLDSGGRGGFERIEQVYIERAASGLCNIVLVARMDPFLEIWDPLFYPHTRRLQIGRASCRESV